MLVNVDSVEVYQIKQNYRRMRKELTVKLLKPGFSLNDYFATDESRIFFKLAKSELPHIKLSSKERALADGLLSICVQERNLGRLLPVWLVTHLYFPSHRIKCVLSSGELLAMAPLELVKVVVYLMLRQPLLMLEKDEPDFCFTYYLELVRIFHALAMDEEESNRGRRELLIEYFYEFQNPSKLYFSDNDLLSVMVLRAEILSRRSRDITLRQRFEVSESFGDPASKVRVGIFMPALSERSETFVTLPLFKYFSSPRFSIHVFSELVELSHDDFLAFAPGCSSLTVIPRNLELCRQEIRKANIGIMVFATNLAAVSSPYVLLASRRVAPIQVAETCSPVTTGMQEIDYFLSGTFTEPPEAQKSYTEKLILLEGPAQAYAFLPRKEKNCPDKIFSRDDLKISENAVVFVSGANLNKITPGMRLLWARILAATPNSCLLLYPFNHNWQRDYPVITFMESLRETALQFGFDDSRWKVLKPLASRDDLLSLISLGDIYLDTINHSGAVSMLDPLLMGLPPVVIEGRRGRGRQASAILRSLGLNEYI
ncbi:MAG TPA: hypothetical protein ENN79_13745, partial [Desulfobacteraceae bacterium]|nr:hypothetical protein [Desulfobacteraceae bacterium]